MLNNWLEKIRDHATGWLIASTAVRWVSVSVAGAALALVAQIVLARTLGAAEYGWYVIYLAWINILVIFAVAGFDTAILKFTATYVALKDWGLQKGLLLASPAVVLALAAAVTVIVLIVLNTFDVGWSDTRRDEFRIALVLIPILSLTALVAQLLRGLKRVLYPLMVEKIFRPLLLLLLIVFASFSSFGLHSAHDAILLNAVTAGSALLVLLVISFSFLPKGVFLVGKRMEAGKWTRVAMPMVFMTGMYVLLAKVDVIMIGQFAGASDAGIYAASGRLTAIVGFGLGAVNSIAAPLLAEYYSQTRMNKLQEILTWSARIAMTFTVFASIFLWLFGTWILSLFGDQFTAGYSAMMIILIGSIANAFAGSVGYMMIMGGQQTLAATIVGGATTLNIIMNIILIPRFGIVGAAIATSTAMIAWNFSMYLYVRIKWGLDSTMFGRMRRET